MTNLPLPPGKMPLFALGELVATPGTVKYQRGGVDLQTLLIRHVTGDWSEMTEDDQRENQFSLGESLRILSSYDTERGRVWAITEADRSVTTILLPEEY